MTSRPVFVRGVGAVTALGLSWRESIAPLAAGKSAIVPVAEFDVEHFPCTVVAPISNFMHQGDRRIALACAASQEAWAAATITSDDSQPKKIGIFMGAESGRAPFATVHALTRAAGGKAPFDHARFGKNARVLAEHCDASQTSPAAVTSLLAKLYGATGPAVTISLACSSGASAIAEAARAIRLGVCDVALCGGVGADVDPLMLAGFGRIGALSVRGVSCPFDTRRDGFVVGEGAAMIVLSAERGTAEVELAGEGRSLDAYNLTAPDPEGDGAMRAMRAALAAAKIDSVDYVQAHGTSTPLNDAVEAMALRHVLGTHIYRTHVSSIKGALGHWIAGAGALGFLCAHEAILTGTLFPTANLANPDRDCDLPHVLGNAIHKTVSTALVNAFAFGGANCSLVLRRCA